MDGVERSRAVVKLRLVECGLLVSCVAVVGGMVGEVAVVIGVVVELVSVVDEVPAIENTSRSVLSTRDPVESFKKAIPS